jgi:excisionase family DNA binding protein
MDPLFHSKKNAALILGVSERTLHSLIATNQLKVRRIGRRVLISSDALDEFARRSQPVGSGLPRRSGRLADRIINGS